MDVGQLTQIVAPDAAPARRPVQRPAMQRGGVAPSALRTVIKLLMIDPSLAANPVDLQVVPRNDPRGVLLIKVLELLRAQPHFTQGMLIEYFRGTNEGEYLNKVSMWDWAPPADGVAAEFSGAFAQLAAQNREERCSALLEKAQTTGLTEEEKIELKQLFADQSPGIATSSISARGSH